MLNMELFDKCRNHLLKQNEKCGSINGSTYRSILGGNSCAIGSLMTDEVYAMRDNHISGAIPSNDLMAIVELSQDVTLSNEDKDMLAELEQIHDFQPVCDWRALLNGLEGRLIKGEVKAGRFTTDTADREFNAETRRSIGLEMRFEPIIPVRMISTPHMEESFRQFNVRMDELREKEQAQQNEDEEKKKKWRIPVHDESYVFNARNEIFDTLLDGINAATIATEKEKEKPYVRYEYTSLDSTDITAHMIMAEA